MEELRVKCHYILKKEYKLVFGSNKDVSDASLILLHGDNIEDYDKQDIVLNT